LNKTCIKPVKIVCAPYDITETFSNYSHQRKDLIITYRPFQKKVSTFWDILDTMLWPVGLKYCLVLSCSGKINIGSIESLWL